MADLSAGVDDLEGQGLSGWAVLGGDERLLNQDERTEEMARRAALVVRARWFALLFFGLYGAVAAVVYQLSAMSEVVAEHTLVPLVAVAGTAAYNAALQFGVARRLPLRGLVELQLILDLVVVTTIVHFSGGALSWFWTAYLVVTLEAAIVLDDQRETWLVLLLGMLMYGGLLVAEHNGVVEPVKMPFMSGQLQHTLAYVMLTWSWAVAVNIAIAVVGGFLVETLRRRERALAVAAVTDAQTGLRNRMYFERRLHGEVEHSREKGRQVALLRIDVDHFKDYSDANGYGAAENLLSQLAGVLAGAARRATAKTQGDDFDAICHFGGAEFAILMPEEVGDKGSQSIGSERHQAEALQVAERIRARVERFLAGPHGVTLSVGVTSFVGGRDSPEALLRRANRALKQAKDDGANRVVLTAF